MSDLHKDQFHKQDTRPPQARDYLDIFDTHPDHLYVKPVTPFTDPQLNGRHMIASLVLRSSATSTTTQPRADLPVYTPEPEGFYVGTTLDDGSVFGE